MRGTLAKLANSKPVWLIYRHTRKIWLRVVAFAVLAIATAVVAQALGQFLPPDLGQRLGANAVDQVLTILASSMLAVTTFSLSIAVSAYASAASTATPRATALLQEDHTTQNVLATFLGAFLFSLVGIVALHAGYYSESGRLVLFFATGLVIALVVVALMRWISHLTDFGRMQDTLDRVEQATTEALERRLEAPWLGGTPLDAPAPKTATSVCSEITGYVQHIDMEALSDTAQDLGAECWIDALPGSFVHPASPLMQVSTGPLSDGDSRRLRTAFVCGKERDFEQDPRFGLIVLTEIASRALSPAVNDPGTAIDVLGRLVRVLAPWRSDVEPVIDYPEIHVPTLRVDALLEIAVRPIARDGAGLYEVQLHLQDTLAALSHIHPDTFRDTALFWSGDALERARTAGLTDRELQALQDAAL